MALSNIFALPPLNPNSPGVTITPIAPGSSVPSLPSINPNDAPTQTQVINANNSLQAWIQKYLNEINPAKAINQLGQSANQAGINAANNSAQPGTIQSLIDTAIAAFSQTIVHAGIYFFFLLFALILIYVFISGNDDIGNGLQKLSSSVEKVAPLALAG